MRRFRLVRAQDVSGVSGVGVVGEGVQFRSGKVALTWHSDVHSVTVFDGVRDVEAIHGHDGSTVIDWLDPPEPGQD